ncbi:5947_t:CDS:2 [Paraglomus brasilianum]|uniref:5947_t:CDS:1 n=1 Tax=Paraglomus brasilianum TaxID=144538 RepID=A0A9N8Z350_9GLOM|nr:5947_t:CDS:2 [Paraglomus brasilianum]
MCLQSTSLFTGKDYEKQTKRDNKAAVESHEKCNIYADVTSSSAAYPSEPEYRSKHLNTKQFHSSLKRTTTTSSGKHTQYTYIPSEPPTNDNVEATAAAETTKEEIIRTKMFAKEFTRSLL